MSQAELLIDVSRPIWRAWRGRPQTGIDRVCLAYIEHFGRRAQAVVQRSGRYFVLNSAYSERLFRLLSEGSPAFRRDFIRLAIPAFLTAGSTPSRLGLLYLNVGHTGLDEPSLTSWISLNEIRAVFLIHDMIPVLHPEYCRAGESAKHRQRIRNVLASAHGIIGNSQATIHDLELFARSQSLPMPRTRAALIAGSPPFKNIRPRRFDRPHFIIVGTIEGRKNHALLLRIWKRLVSKYRSDAPILVIAGQRGWEANDAITMLDHPIDLTHSIIEVGNASDKEVAELIAGARALLMPSFAEGFGLPVAEALQIGTPVIASDLPVFREFAGDIPTYLAPVEESVWEATIEAFMSDSPERQRQLSQMAAYQAPDWVAHFKVVEEWLQTLP